MAPKRQYTVEGLSQQGRNHAFSLLLQHLVQGDEPFVTYGSMARYLEKRLNIGRIFPLHIGPVAGYLMDQIETIDPKAPPINGLVTRPNGIPGDGFGSFHDRLWRERHGHTWESLSRERKLEVVREIRAAIRTYPKWEELYRRLTGEDFAKTVPVKEFTERDGKPSDTDRPAGSGESLQHRRLKDWACANPRKLGLRGMKGKTEEDLPSGDRMDVLFTDGASFAVVEVKSRLSNENDWKRGLYQCVKYRAVLKARELPLDVPVEAVLLIETPISDELKVRAKALDVRLAVHWWEERE